MIDKIFNATVHVGNGVSNVKFENISKDLKPGFYQIKINDVSIVEPEFALPIRRIASPEEVRNLRDKLGIGTIAAKMQIQKSYDAEFLEDLKSFVSNCTSASDLFSVVNECNSVEELKVIINKIPMFLLP